RMQTCALAATRPPHVCETMRSRTFVCSVMFGRAALPWPAHRRPVAGAEAPALGRRSGRDGCGLLLLRVRLLGERQAAQIVGGRRGLRRGGDKRAWLVFQEVNPAGDVSRVPELAVERKLGAKEGGGELGDQLLGGIGARPEAPAHALAPVQTRLVPGPV